MTDTYTTCACEGCLKLVTGPAGAVCDWCDEHECLACASDHCQVPTALEGQVPHLEPTERKTDD